MKSVSLLGWYGGWVVVFKLLSRHLGQIIKLVLGARLPKQHIDFRIIKHLLIVAIRCVIQNLNSYSKTSMDGCLNLLDS